MKKILVFIFICMNVTLFAKQIDVDKAKAVGKTFLMQKTELPVRKSITDIQLVYSCTSGQKDINPETYYYVFNMDSTGFVIVSGTDDVIPVLAYSTESIFDPDNIPPNMAEVLNRYKKEIRYVMDNNITSTAEVKKQWNELISGKIAVRKVVAASVSPLLGEIKWGQGRLYNDSCPYDQSAGYYYNYKCPAGCVAVAMGQIMKYWGYPAQGTGSKCYYDNYGNSENHYGNYGQLCANFENTTYNYHLMPDELDDYSSSAGKRAVAQLLYHCGVALHMKYGPQASGSYTYQDDYWIDIPDDAGNYYIDARTAFKRYFGYSQAEGIQKSKYSDAAWIAILKEQLSNWQPVLYAGTGSDGGHAFVCDGYDANDFFHFNWGWGGYANCYAHVSSLVADGSDFSSGQHAIINIKATKEEKTLGWVKSSDYVNSYYSSDTAYFILQPDTCLKVYNHSDSWNAASAHGMGMTFDPYSESFGEYNFTSLFDKSYAYRLDTLQISSIYYWGRNGYKADCRDTLRIYLSYYEPYSGEPSNGDYRFGTSYYSNLLPNIVKMGGSMQKGDKIRPIAANTVVVDYILTEEDTAEAGDMPGAYNAKDIKIPLNYNSATVSGFEIPAGAVTGIMTKFIPGYNYDLGDTLYTVSNLSGYDVPTPVNNVFGIVVSYNNIFVDYSGYNGFNFESKELRYQMFGDYQDSCYLTSTNYLPHMAYHITYDIAPTHAKLQIDTVVCGEYIYNGTVYNESGQYTHRFFTTAGDSIVVINLTVYNESIGAIGNIQGNALITQAGTYTYSIAPVTNAVVYQWSISNPQWSVTGNGTQITLNITQPGEGVLSVKAIHANGICKTETVTLSIQSNVSVLDYEVEVYGIRIYPNPVEDDVVVLIEDNTLPNGEIQLFDIFGRLLNTQKITNRQTFIDMTLFSAGVYVLQIKGDNRIIKSAKIIKTE